MFKNAKLLKSVTVALACALVLGIGLFVGLYYVGAAANTVTLYVSDQGDNTTGSDEASAFTSIMSATQAANKMALKPGTKLKLLVVERTTVTTSNLAEQVYDTENNKVPVYIEGYGYDKDDGNRPEIYCTYRDTSNTNSYRQWMHLGCDMEVYGVKFLSKVQDETYGSKPSEHYCTRYLNAGGYYAVFDDVVFTTEDPANIKWELRADRYASASVIVRTEGHSGFALKNGDYTNCNIKITQYSTMNYDIDVSFENATLPTVNILANGTGYTGNPERDQKAKSITVTFGEGTKVTGDVVTNADDGYYYVPDGITVNFKEGCVVEGAIAPKSDITAQTVVSDHTFNYEGGTFKGDVFSGFSGAVTGTLTNNVTGSKDKLTIDGTFYGAGKMISGAVKNNISSGKFATFYGGLGVSKTVNLAITNKISGDAEIGTFYGGSYRGSNTGSVHNIVDSDDVTINSFYGGNAASSSYSHLYSLTNDISGGTFVSDFTSAWNHGKGVTDGYTTGTVTNNISGGTFKCDYRGAINGFVSAIENNISGGTFNKTFYGGASHTTSIVSIKNNISGGTFAGAVYGGSKGYSSGAKVQTIENKLTDGVKISTFYGGSGSGSNPAPIGEITEGQGPAAGITNIIDNATITTFYGGSNTGAVTGNITTTVKDGIISTYYGGSNTGAVTGNIESTISGGAFETAVYPGNKAVLNIKPDDSVAALTFKGTVSNSTQNATTTIYGGNKPINLGSAASIYAEALAGEKNVVFCQTAQWTNGTTYVSLPSTVNTAKVFAVNRDADVSGSAEIVTSGSRKVLQGTTGNGSTLTTGTSKLNGYSFILENKLKVRFFIPLNQVQSYIDLTGNWSYSVTMAGQEIAAGSTFEAMTGAGDVQCATFVTDLGIAATDFDKKLVVTWSGNETVFEKSVYELLEGGIASSSTEVADLLKALHNYGVEASNVFDGTATELKYPNVTYTGTYNDAPARTSSEEGFEFFATSLSLDEEVSLNFYLKVADGVTADQMKFTVKNKAGNKTLADSKISVTSADASEYDLIVSVKLDINEMADSYTLTAALTDGTVVATCTNSIASSCAGYITANNNFAPVSKALLAYIEKAVAAL